MRPFFTNFLIPTFWFQLFWFKLFLIFGTWWCLKLNDSGLRDASSPRRVVLALVYEKTFEWQTTSVLRQGSDTESKNGVDPKNQMSRTQYLFFNFKMFRFSNFQIFKLSNFQTFKFSNFQTFKLSYFDPFKPPYPQELFPNYSSWTSPTARSVKFAQ